MKILFKKPNNEKDIFFVNANSQNTDEVIKEGSIKTLYLKSDEKVTLRKLFILIRKMVALAKSVKAKRICFDFNDFERLSTRQDLVLEELAEIIGTELTVANYEFTEYKSKPENKLIKEISILNCPKSLEKFILKGLIIGEEVNKTRTLSNTPGGDMTPKILAEKAQEAVKGLPVKVTVLGEKEMAKQKMEAILAVGRGSDEESKFIIMEYFGGKKGEKPVVLVGKGVTFDSGGINIKPGFGLFDMHMDMSGGAAAIHTLTLAARLKIKKNVVVLIPSVENMVSAKSFKVGDIVKTMSGQTIEILNTDAEGRVILADALTYAEKYKPEIVFDIATLTSSSVVALGEKMSAFFTNSNDESLIKKIQKIGNKTNDYVWQFPLWEEYENEIKGNFGDWTNIHNKNSHYGDVIYSSVFLKQFTKNYPWVHIDIAPRMTATTGEYLAPGALGTPVRLLYKFIEDFK